MILGVDLGRNCGWALVTMKGGEEKLAASGTVVWKDSLLPATKRDIHHRSRKIIRRLADALDELPRGMFSLVHVAYEQPFFDPKKPTVYASQLLLSTHLWLWCHDNGIKVHPLLRQVICQATGDRDRLSKEQVVQMMRLAGHDPQNEHEADAQAIALCCQRRVVKDALIAEAERSRAQ